MAHIRDLWYFIKKIFGPSSHPRTQVVKVTCYGWHDNDPPGAAIAYPFLNGGKGGLHYRAGGEGSYDDPTTFAANPEVFPVGTMIYIPRLMKYFIMEDLCGAAMQCKAEELPIVDVWVGGTSKSDRGRLVAREEELTDAKTMIVVNPSNAFSWDPKPLFKDD